MGGLPLRPEAASNFAADHDLLFFALTALTIFFTLVVGAMVLFFAIKYRRGSKADRSNANYESPKLEVVWLVVPTVLGLAMFVWGAVLFVKKRTFPDHPMEIFVVGKQWMWHVQHSNGVRENNELHIPLGQPIKLTMISQDVVHGFYLPQFRVQYHVVPGRYTSQWFIPTRVGRFNLFCSVHCGTQHSEMGGYVYVMKPNDFAQWLANGGNRFVPAPKTMAEAGQQLYKDLACGNCHVASDTERAPSLYGLFGKQVNLSDGSSAVADDEYVRESILDPYTRLTKGYSATMPAYRDALNEEQVLSLLAYLRTLGSSAEGPTTPQQPPTVGGTANPPANPPANSTQTPSATERS